MLDLVSVLPDAREGVRRLSQVLSGVVANTRMSELRSLPSKGTSHSFPGGSGMRMLSSDDAQLSQESIDRLAALIVLGPQRSTAASMSGAADDAAGVAGPDGVVPAGTTLDSMTDSQIDQYLTEIYDMLLTCRVPEALGELTALAASALLGAGGPGAGGANSTTTPGEDMSRHEEQQRRRSIDLARSLDMYVRDGGPSPARASVDGLLCGQKLGGHAQALMESISQLLLSCLFDPIWRHRDLLAQPRVRDMVLALTAGPLLPALATIVTKLRLLLAKPAGIEAASHAWLLGFVARCFTGLCRCMKAMVEFETCSALWAQLGDTFSVQLISTHLIERFSSCATAVHPSYMTWRPPPPPGVPVEPEFASHGAHGGVGAGAGGMQRPGDTYLELCTAVELFMEGLFHLTWHHTARLEEAAAAGPPPPLLVRHVLAAMEPEGSGSVADMLAAAAAAATGGGSAAVPAALRAAAFAANTGAVGAWPGLVAGPATHSLAVDWLAHVVARLDRGEVVLPGGGTEAADAANSLHGGELGSRAARRNGPLLNRPGPVDQDDLPLLLSVCLAVAAAGGPQFIANGGPALSAYRYGSSPLSAAPMAPTGGRRRSIDWFFGAGGSNGGVGYDNVSESDDSYTGHTGGGAGVGQASMHANRLLRLTVRGLKAMAATQDAELAPYPAIHAAHSCAVEMHKLLGESGAADDSALGPGQQFGTVWPFTPVPPPHTTLLLDAFQAALLCYSAFLHPDPDKDPLTLRAVERCHEQLLDLCTATGQGLRTGVAAVVYATQAGLLPALEAVLRSAALTCRLDTTRVLLTAVLSSVPALQRVQLRRDGYLFLTMRKLVIACVNLACPHPQELPGGRATVPHPNARKSLTLILQQCSVGTNPFAAPSAPLAPVLEAAPLSASSVAAAAARAAVREATASRGSFNAAAAAAAAAAPIGGITGRPLILPLAVELLETVRMLVTRFIEVHDGRVAAASNISFDAAGNVITSNSASASANSLASNGGGGGRNGEEGEGGAGDGGEEEDDEEGERDTQSDSSRRRRSFEREASDLLPLAQLLPFALWWLGPPTADLVDALAQEVINGDGSGTLYGDPEPEEGDVAAGPPAAEPPPPPPPSQRPSSRPQSPTRRRRSSVDLSRAGGLATRPTVRAPPAPQSAPPPPTTTASPPPVVLSFSSWPRGCERSALVLSRCADSMHTLFRLMVTLSDLQRKAPHADWAAMIAALQPQQLVARAVQVLVHGIQRQQQERARNGASEGTRSRPYRPSLAYPVLLSSLLSASVCGVQTGWLGPESFGIPSASADPAEPDQPPPHAPAGHHHHQPSQQHPSQGAAGSSTSGGGAAAAGCGPVYGPLFSRVRRYTVISANPEGRAVQWALVGDEDEETRDAGGAAAWEADGVESAACGVGDEAEEGQPHGDAKQRRRRVVLLQAAAQGGAWSTMPALPGSAVVPTRALQLLVSEYGSAADKVLFDLLLRGLASKKSTTPPPPTGPTPCAPGAPPQPPPADDGAVPERSFFWVPPSQSVRLHTCSNPCCMNLSGLHEAQLRLAACPRCGSEWYCSRHCQAMHWHSGHKGACFK